MEYSESFKEILEDADKLIQENGITGADFEQWTNMRYFISEIIDRDGTILHIGCNNGFLLRCLMEWSPYELIPYGIDKDEEILEKARQMFPEHRENFICANVKRDDLPEGFSNKFDFIYWNIWEFWQFKGKQMDALFKVLSWLEEDGGLMLGFYEENGPQEKIEKIKKQGLTIRKIVENPWGIEKIALLKKQENPVSDNDLLRSVEKHLFAMRTRA